MPSPSVEPASVELVDPTSDQAGVGPVRSVTTRQDGAKSEWHFPESFPADAGGYRRLHRWLEGFGTVVVVGVEGTGRTARA